MGIVLSTARIWIHESLGNAAYGVTLDSRPTGTATVLATSSDTSTVTVTPPSLTFTSDNWDTLQFVSVYPVNDDRDNPGDERVAMITNSVSGGDASATVTITVGDD